MGAKRQTEAKGSKGEKEEWEEKEKVIEKDSGREASKDPKERKVKIWEGNEVSGNLCGA